MQYSTEFATDTELLDQIMEKGIVVEVWDRIGLALANISEMQVTVSALTLFIKGKNPPFGERHFLKIKP